MNLYHFGLSLKKPNRIFLSALVIGYLFSFARSLLDLL